MSYKAEEQKKITFVVTASGTGNTDPYNVGNAQVRYALMPETDTSKCLELLTTGASGGTAVVIPDNILITRTSVTVDKIFKSYSTFSPSGTVGTNMGSIGWDYGFGNPRLYLNTSWGDVSLQTIPEATLTGTVATTNQSDILTGTLTEFTTELGPGSYVKMGSAIVWVDSIESDTSLTMKAVFSSDTTGVTASTKNFGTHLDIIWAIKPGSGGISEVNCWAGDKPIGTFSLAQNIPVISGGPLSMAYWCSGGYYGSVAGGAVNSACAQGKVTYEIYYKDL